jgi:hypothetical protein
MSSNTVGQKAEDAKVTGAQKAGEAKQATKVHSTYRTYVFIGFLTYVPASLFALVGWSLIEFFKGICGFVFNIL